MFGPIDSAIKSAWNYFLDGFAQLILPELEIGDHSDDSGHCDHNSNTHEDEAFRLWDDIGGEG